LRRIDGVLPFVICSKAASVAWISSGVPGELKMRRFSIKTLVAAAALATLATAASAQSATPWVLSPDMGYGYDKEGKMSSYKLGTNNAKELFKGAKKVPRGTLFFLGDNGQLYMRTGPYLEGDGKFKFGPG
jgi:hypothetical protein